jgi:hypothetical protein
MTASRESLMAFIDGELSSEEERRVAAEIAASPALNAYVEEQRALKSRVDADFAPILTAPVPERFERMVIDAPVSRAAGPRRNPFSMQLPRLWIPAAAAAAGIAIGIGLSNLVGGAMMESRNGALLATGGLARILSTQLAASQSATASTRVGLSFRNKDGNFCRTFQTAVATNALAGIACREEGDWRILATAATQADAGEFRQAASSLPNNLRATLNSMISGKPLNAAAERTARSHNWTK